MKIIESDGIKVLINIGNASATSLNRLIFNNQYRNRSQVDLERITQFKTDNAKRMIFWSNGSIICKASLNSYVKTRWEYSANGNLCLDRWDSEKFVRDFKKLTTTELIQLSVGLRNSRDGFLGISELNPIGQYLRNSLDLKEVIKTTLANEKKHFLNLDNWIKYYESNRSYRDGYNFRNVTSFTRLYANDENHNIPFGCVKHTCSVTENKFDFWSFTKRELWNQNPKIKFVNSSLKFVSIEKLETDFHTCKQCGSLKIDFKHIETDNHFHNEIVCKNGHTKVCNNCYEINKDEITRNSVHSYRYLPRLKFHTFKNGKINKSRIESKNIFYGWELELESRTRDLNKKEIAYQIEKDSNNYLFCKEDGSINNGFEVVSHPATFNAIKNMDLQKMVLRHRDTMKGFHTSTCGMHIHINRNSFTDLQLFKFILFLNENQDLTKSISQRRNDDEFHWCQLNENLATYVKSASAKKIKEMKNGESNRKPNKKYIPCNQVNGNIGRYSAINMQNENTIEVRIFKSNMDESSFRKNIEFVDCLYWFCKEHSSRDLTINNFVEFANRNKKDYSNLVKFIARLDS